jgi:adenylate cyclase
VFCDLRRFTAFTETSEPEEIMGVLRDFHAALGDLIHRFEGTLEQFVGDGLTIFFNDPIPCEDGPLRAIRMAVAMRNRVQQLTTSWSKRGHDLGFAVGIAQGFATLGRIGFEGRYEYTAIGSVMNLASRLCSVAEHDQILVTQRVHNGADGFIVSEPKGDMALRGFSRPVTVYNVLGLDAARASS